ncbi:MAG TPA: metal-dependent hydrolase [Pyrinomonadaceae bacterium]
MDNLTHSLVGLAAAKAGLERQSPYATFVCVAAANLPDIDIVARAGGPAFYLQHHRGVTHSIVGTLALAVALPLLFYAAERVRARARGQDSRARLKGLLVCSLLLSASHPLLDWTNSYGVRPFLPWDGRWIYGDLLFIIDPWVWLVLGGACFLLAKTRWAQAVCVALAFVILLLFARIVWQSNAALPFGPGAVPGWSLALWSAGMLSFLALRAKGAGARLGRGAGAAALAFVLFYCCALWVVQRRARAEAESAARALASQTGERVQRVAATPVLADPLTWRCLAENDRSAVRFDMRLGRGPEELGGVVRYGKPAGEDEEVVRRASDGYAARVLLDFARFPVARVRREGRAGWVVQFADLRFTEPGARARPGGFALDVPVGP